MEFTITGKVTGGNKTGRRLGFPTANIPLAGGADIADGVYRARIRVGDREFDGVANVGLRPTVGGSERLLEVHILDFSEDIYDRELTVALTEFIRPERKFDSLEELREQIKKDVETIKNKR